jgi:hypothetical protein
MEFRAAVWEKLRPRKVTRHSGSGTRKEGELGES